MRWPDIDRLPEGNRFRRKLRTIRVTVGCIAAAPLVYVAAGFIAAQQRAIHVLGPASNRILVILYVISAVMALLGLAMPERRVVKGSLPPRSADGREAMSAQRLERYMSAYFKTCILRSAIFESVGIYGLAGAVMTGDTMILLSLNFFAVLFVMLTFPGREKFLRFVQRMEESNQETSKPK
jgi:hypothetical protein